MEQNTIFDDSLRTVQERHPKLLIPVINDVFGTDYAENEKITRLPEEYQKVLSKVIADSCSMIRDQIYHLEMQSTSDGTMILRMLEYDFMIGLNHVEMVDGTYRISFPRSAVLYIRHKPSDSYQTMDTMELVMPDGQVVQYQVPTIRLNHYSLEEIFEKHLYLYLVFYILRYEKDIKAIGMDKDRADRLIAEYRYMLKRLHDDLKDDYSGLYHDLVAMIKNIVKYILRKETELYSRLEEEVMGGKVLPLPSDQLREQYIQGKKDGELKGELKNFTSQICKKIQKNKTIEEIAEDLEDDVEHIRRIYDIAVGEAPDYDVDHIVESYIEKYGLQ